MHRAVTVAMVLAVLAGSVPAAASLAQQSPSDAEPGASFAGVVGVQESEVNSEVASRSLDQRLKAAGTNESKAGVVANESEQLEQRLAELKAEKEQLKQAYENGSISKGEYQARLAVLAAELRSVERQATQTAEAAETLPEEALREKGANVSKVRNIAQQANRTGGGEVAQAARNITGGNVGNGLGNAPANASERGPPNGSDGGPPGDAGGENATDRKPTDAGPPTDAGNDTGPPGDAGNDTGAPSDAGNGTNQPADGGNSSDASDGGNASDRGNAGEDSATNATDRSGNDSSKDGSDTANRSTEADNGSADAGNGDGGSGSDGNGDGNDDSEGNESSEGNNASGKGNSNETANESDGNQLSERMTTVPTDRNTAFEFSPVEMLDWVDPVSRTILG